MAKRVTDTGLVIAQLGDDVAGMRARVEQLEAELRDARTEARLNVGRAVRLQGVVADREARIVELDARVSELLARVAELETADMFWDDDDPERGPMGSGTISLENALREWYDPIQSGEPLTVDVMMARLLPTRRYRCWYDGEEGCERFRFEEVPVDWDAERAARRASGEVTT